MWPWCSSIGCGGEHQPRPDMEAIFSQPPGARSEPQLKGLNLRELDFFLGAFRGHCAADTALWRLLGAVGTSWPEPFWWVRTIGWLAATLCGKAAEPGSEPWVKVPPLLLAPLCH